MNTKNKNIFRRQIFFLAAISFIIVWMIGYNSILLAPLRLYNTAIHELWHAIMVVLTGGRIVDVGLHINGSGFVKSTGGISLLISPAGYIGSAFTGAMLIIASQNNRATKILLVTIAILIISLGIWEISIAFISAFIVSIAICYIVIKTKYQQFTTIFLGTILGFASIADIRTILSISGETDAGILARSFGMDFLALPIAILFAIISLYIWYRSIKYILKKSSL